MSVLLLPGDHGENFCYYPPPTECGRLLEITEQIYATTLPPPNLVVIPQFSMVKIGRKKSRPNTLVSAASARWRTLAEKV